jgi:uncharacterized membrane protein
MSYTRKYLPTISELIDRLSIIQLKEIFIPEHKEKYAQEIKDIVHDLDKLGLEKEYDYATLGQLIRSVIVLSQMNLHIWHNESNFRAGKGEGNLELTHGLNGIRNTAKNKIQDQLGVRGRKDYKVDCIAEEFDDWEVSWYMFNETRARSTKKGLSWRLIAFVNSWLVLEFGLTQEAFYNAVIMNVTGVVFFYFHERIWNNVDGGKYTK